MRHAHCDQEGSEALLVHHVKKCLEVYQKPRGSFSPFDRSSDFPSAFQPNKLVVPNILQWMRQRRWNQHLRYGKDLQEKKEGLKFNKERKQEARSTNAGLKSGTSDANLTDAEIAKMDSNAS